MANGRPGDNTLTDVIVHQQEVFGAEIDGLITEIAALSKPAIYKVNSQLFISGNRSELIRALEELKASLEG